MIPGESGKSTIVKQMRILHEQGGFSEQEKIQKVLDIKRNLRDGMISILTGKRVLCRFFKFFCNFENRKFYTFLIILSTKFNLQANF